MPTPEQEALEAFKDAQEMHMYAVWAIPPVHVLPRIKKVMEGLRTEFGGPEIEPHIIVVGSMLRTEEDAIHLFREACNIITRFECTVDHIETSPFFYQCVSLVIDPIEEVALYLFFILSFHGIHKDQLSLLVLTAWDLIN